MNNHTDSSIINYEQPLNERMRTFLRFEQLTYRFMFFIKQQESSATHAALMTLIEILGLLSRGDLKQELLKEIKRQVDTLQLLENQSNLDTAKLTEVLAKHKSIFDRLHALHGQFDSHLKSIDFINSIRQRAVIPGGTCDFDLPEYHHWLAQPFTQRNKVLQQWIAPFEIVQEGVGLSLQLIRESTPYTHVRAQKGFYNQNLNQYRPNQLIRIGIAKENNFFPECSAGKHRFSIRFLTQIDPNTGPKQTQTDLEFKLACCTF